MLKLRQKLIVYSLDGEVEQIYCTAYSNEQAGRALWYCATWLAAHGLLNETSRPVIEDAHTFFAYSYD